MRRFTSLIAALIFCTGNMMAQTFAHDASMYKLILPSYSEFKSVLMTGVFKNSGTDTLHNVIINWTINDGVIQQLTKTDLNVARNQTWPFTAPNNLILNTEGNITVKAWVSLPNGFADEKPANDTLTQIIQVIESYPERHILIEEVTGAWCGYCPRAPIIYRVNVLPNYPNTIFTAIHTGDGMTITDSRDFMNTYVTGVPCGFVDRKKSQMDPGIDFAPEDWQGLLSKMDNRFTPAKLNIYNYYDPATRNWKIDVVSDFVFDMAGNYRMNCYILEDSLFGTGSSWDQRNFFNGGAADPYMSLQGAGDPLPNYKHNHVVRKMTGGSWGAANIIPATVKKGDRYVYSVTFRADTKWKMENVHIVGILQQWDSDKFKRPILNAVEGDVELLTGIEKEPVQPVVRIFPNPVKDNLWVELNSTLNSDFKVQVFNSPGQEVFTRKFQNQAGQQQIPVSMKSLIPGIYFVKVITAGGISVTKVIKE